MHSILKKFVIVLFFFYSWAVIAQNGKLPPFQLQLQAINGTHLPGLHSFAFAQSGDKWLFIGGRTNGLHGLNNNDSFPPEYKNDEVIVIDTSSWNFYKASLHQLPMNVADPMRSANMEYIQSGDYLYMIGGYGWDSIQEGYVTFPTLTAVHVNHMIDAVINSKPLSSSIRQLTDTNLAVCGGDLARFGNNFHLIMGHNFNGRYDKKPSVLFTQVYSNSISTFTLEDNGTTLSVSNFHRLSDTVNFHRRDFTMCPVIKPDGSSAIGIYGGVFKKQADLPYLEPILLSSNGTAEVKNYQQWMSQYSCAVLPIYDALNKTMYTTFFGGISLHDYDVNTGTIQQDTLLPFINDITTLTQDANDHMEETVLPLQLPGLLGCNARFILNKALPIYANEVIDLNQLAKKEYLAGYILGGIHAQKGNLGQSVANDVIYRVYLKPLSLNAINEEQLLQRVNIFPNPAAGNSLLEFTLNKEELVNVRILDAAGKVVKVIAEEKLHKGNHRLSIDISNCPTGFYLCELQCATTKVFQKLVITSP
jgi:hypothetical protein